VTVNDIHDVENGERIYVEAIQSSYRTVLFTTAIITFIFTFFLSDIPVIGNKKKWNKKMNEEKLKSVKTNMEEKKDVIVSVNTNDNDTPYNISETSGSKRDSIAASENTIKLDDEGKNSVN